MRTDSLFYRLFKNAPELLFELAGLDFDSSQKYDFRSEEIKQTAFCLDGIMTPPVEKTELPFIFVEVQFQPDPYFYSRFFCEIFFFLHQNKPAHPWQAVVIYPARQIETDGSLHYASLLESNSIKRIYLEDFSNPPEERIGLQLIRLIVLDAEQAVNAAQNLVNRIKIQIDQQTVAHWLEWVETILVYKLPSLSREEIQEMLGYNDTELKQTRFYQDVFAEGFQEGRQEGLHEGEAKILIRHFKRLFGILSAETIDSIKQLNNEQLESLADHLFEIKKANDLEDWLTKHLNT